MRTRRPYTPAPATNGKLRIDSIIAYMNANYSKPLFLDDVAKKANMTRGSFCRFIRKGTGKTYLESLNEIRIAHICQLLLGTSDNISEIAYKMGYNNVAYFHRFFKRQKGCTPKEYRERFLPGNQISEFGTVCGTELGDFASAASHICGVNRRVTWGAIQRQFD